MIIYKDVMVDLETTGLQSDRNAILQISAVKFNYDTEEISPDFFDRCLIIPKHRAWDESTRDWWIRQDQTIIQEIFQRAEEARKVIKDFADWAYPQGHLRFWSKPTHFDFNFLASYFNDESIVNPFDFREANDMNSFLRGIYAPNNVDKLNIPFTGRPHNALDDVLHQIKVLLTHKDNVFNKEKPNVIIEN